MDPPSDPYVQRPRWRALGRHSLATKYISAKQTIAFSEFISDHPDSRLRSYEELERRNHFVARCYIQRAHHIITAECVEEERERKGRKRKAKKIEREEKNAAIRAEEKWFKMAWIWLTR
jgi:hypothetical protein